MRSTVTGTRWLLAVCSLMCVTRAMADGMAFVNMERVFSEYYRTLRANAAFELKKEDYRARVDVLREQLEANIAEARKIEQDLQERGELLSEEARRESQRRLQLWAERIRQQQAEFNQFRRAGLRELEKQRQAAEEELIAQISEFVRNYCRERGYDMIFDITGKSLNRMPVVLLYPEDQDITDEIMAELNRGHEEEVAQALAEREAAEGTDTGGLDPDDDSVLPEGDGAGPLMPGPGLGGQ